ncbi:MAG: hypothetical protein GY822_27545 [Deltaproteobacteria bacterium]|nr:hypothetical protein [Deltaproteobacteria bacterium]
MTNVEDIHSNQSSAEEISQGDDVVTARSIALMTNDPERFHVALHGLRRVVRLPKHCDGVGVGASVDAAVLLSRKPTVPKKWSLARMVGPLKGRCTVVQMRRKEDVRPRQSSAANLGPFRFRHLAAAHVGGPLSTDEAAANTEFWLADLPDFLLRSREGQTEGEAFFLYMLNALHEKGCLERGVYGTQFLDVMRQVFERDPQKCKRSVSVATGLEHLTLSYGLQTSVVKINGLLEEDADDVDPTYTDSSMGRERLRRFRATLVLGGVDSAMKEQPQVADGTRVHFLPDDAAVLVGRDLEPNIRPFAAK